MTCVCVCVWFVCDARVRTCVYAYVYTNVQVERQVYYRHGSSYRKYVTLFLYVVGKVRARVLKFLRVQIHPFGIAINSYEINESTFSK